LSNKSDTLQQRDHFPILKIAGIIALLLGVIFGFSPAEGGTQLHTASSYDWLQFNFDSKKSGFNTRESILTLQNVRNLRMLFQVKLPAIADGAPAYLSKVQTHLGTKDLLFITTKAGHIIALDGQTGAKVWVQQHAAGSCRINNGSEPCYTTSSPAVDPNRKYVYSYGLDGHAHKHRVGDGVEITGGGWPQLTTLKPFDEKGSSALTIATTKGGRSYLYVANGGYLGDRGDYQGHATAIDLSNGTQRVFNTNCSNQTVHFVEKPGKPDCAEVRSAIWARAGVVYDEELDRVYVATGNGPFKPILHCWGDTVFALNPDGTGKNGDPLDSYTPRDYSMLELRDLDLGSTAPAILPVPRNSAIKHLAVQSGKDGKLRLLNLDNLSGGGRPGGIGGEIGKLLDIPQGGMMLTAIAVWVDPIERSTWIFVANSGGTSGLRLTIDSQGIPALSPVWKNSNPGTSSIIANGVLFSATSHHIGALDPKTGSRLWENNKIGPVHWESPIVSNGVLYMTDESRQLTAFTTSKPK
jgi:outer membrane protein assembly factor BamB